MKVRNLIHKLIEHDPETNIYLDNGNELINLLDTEERRVVAPKHPKYGEPCIVITLGDPR